MPLELPAGLVVVLNVAGWPAIQLSVSWLILKCPSSWFEARGGSGRSSPWEDVLYRRVLRVRAWKRFVPDAARWFRGGVAKTLPRPGDAGAVRRLAAETRRGEVAHWLMILAAPVFFLWNPIWADAVMVVYALASNLPCIVVQRFVRARLETTLRRRAAPVPP